MSNLQIDNQLFNRGDFDFPVVMLGQKNEQRAAENPTTSYSYSLHSSSSTMNENDHISQSTRIYDLIAKSRHDSLISVRLDFEVFDNVHVNNIGKCVKYRIFVYITELYLFKFTGIKDVVVKTDYISLYIEDSYFTYLLKYFDKLNPQNLIIRQQEPEQRPLSPTSKEISQNAFGARSSSCVNGVYVPKKIIISSQLLGKPLRINKLTINEINLLLSVHSSIRMYIALDRSPLHFNVFERRNILTTHFKLGHSLAMHYLSGAIFGAGLCIFIHLKLNLSTGL